MYRQRATLTITVVHSSMKKKQVQVYSFEYYGLLACKQPIAGTANPH